MKKKKQTFIYPKIGELDYRGVHVDFIDNDYGQCVYGIFTGEGFKHSEVNFGAYNLGYEDDAKFYIDLILDRKNNDDK